MKPRLYISKSAVRSSIVVAAAWLAALPAQAQAPFTFTDVADEASLVALWELNEAAGSTTVADLEDVYTGNVFSGTTLGVPSAMTTLGTAAHFNGSSGKIDIPYAEALNPESYTIQAWAQLQGGSGYRSPLTSRRSSPQEGYIFYAHSSGYWDYWGGRSTGWSTTAGPDFIVNQWVHLAATYDDADKVRVFYINGHPVATGSGSLTPLRPLEDEAQPPPLRIGAGATEGAGSFWFNGAVDNVAVLNQALAHQSIANHYNAKSNYAVEVAADGPVAYWRLGEQAGTSAYNALDVTAHTGTYSNVTLRQLATPIGNDIDTAAAFGGSSSKVTVPYHADLNPSDSFTVEAWARVDGGDGTYRTVLSSRDSSGGSYGFTLYAANNDLWQFRVGTGSDSSWHTTNASGVALGKWVYLVGTYDAGTSAKTFYINGIPVTSEAGVTYAANTNPNRNFFIGMGGDSGTDFPFHGLLDEVAVYDHALAPSAVDRRFLVGSTGGELHYWVGEDTHVHWSGNANWSPTGSPAGKTVVFDDTGASATAGDVTNTVDTNYTVASIVYENSGGNHHTTLIESGTTLTLESPSGAPKIFVSDAAQIDGQLASSQGITKARGGTLTLGGSGGTAMNLGGTGVTVAEGTLRLNREGLSFDTGVFHASTPIRVESGATLEIANRWNLRQTSDVTVDGGTLSFTHTHGSRDDSENYLNTLHLIDATVTGHGIRLGNDTDILFTVAGDAGSTIATPLLLVNSSSSGRPPRTLTLDVADGAAANDLVMSGVIYDYTGRGNNIIEKTGAGTLLLSGNNTFTGTVAVNDGTVVVGHQNALGAQTNALTFADVEGAALSLGGFDVSIGSLAGGGASGGNVDLGDNVLTVGLAGTSTDYSGTISGTGGLIKDGQGTLTLSGPLDYSGETIVDGGMLVLNRSGGALADGITGQFTSSGNLITVNGGATLRVNQSYALGDGGQHQVVVNGGTLDFHAGHNYQNDITLTGAAITTGHDDTPWRTGYHAGNAVITVNESSVSSTISGQLAFVRIASGGHGKTTFDVANGAAEHDLVLSAVIVDHPGRENMALVKDGPGIMLLSGDNTFAGAVAIDGGTLIIGHQNALGTTPKAVTLADVAGATLSLGGFDLALGSLAGGGESGGSISLGGNTLTVGALETSTNYGGTISGTGGLVKTGDGILTLSGPLNYAGETLVDGGTLVLSKPDNSMSTGRTGQFGSSGQTITVNSGATLRLTEQWVLGDGGQHHLIADGGTIDFHTRDNYQNSIELTGGAITTRDSGRPWRTGYNAGDALITVNPSDVPSTISGLLCFVRTTTGAPGKTTFDVADGPAEHDLIVSSVISDHGSLEGMVLVKDGPGTMVLSGANTFWGGVDINAGTLLVNNTSGSGTGTGPVAVKDGGTLGGTGTIAGATTIEGGGTLATGTSIGTLTFGSSLTLEDGAVWDWEFINNTDGSYDQAVGPNLVLPTEGTIALNIWGLDGHSVGWYDEFTIFTGDVESFDAGLFQLENHSDWTRGWKVSLGNSLVLTAVPEPGAWLLLLSALACGMLVRRRR